MKRSSLLALASAFAAALSAPPAAEAQGVLKKIGQDAAKRVADKKAKRDSVIVETTGGTVDSALQKTGRPVDAAIGKVGAVADSAMNRAERALVTRFGPEGPSAEELSAALERGRAVITQIRFVGASDQLEASSERTLKTLAEVVAATPGVYMSQVFTDDSGDAAADKALSDRRAGALKARLVAAGVDANRFFTTGNGSAPPTDAAASDGKHARIEVVKVQ